MANHIAVTSVDKMQMPAKTADAPVNSSEGLQGNLLLTMALYSVVAED
jgi:hypothetical protein